MKIRQGVSEKSSKKRKIEKETEDFHRDGRP